MGFRRPRCLIPRSGLATFFRDRLWSRQNNKRRSRLPHIRPLTLEPLETRALLAASPLGPVEPLGSLVYQSLWDDQVAAAGQTPSMTFELSAGETLSVVVEPGETLQPAVELSRAGTLLQELTTGAGVSVPLQAVSIPEDGTYTLTVGGQQDSVGSFTARILRNAAIETETYGGAANGAAAAAQDLDGGFLALAGAASQRTAVAGRLAQDTPGADWYRFTLADGQSTTLTLAGGVGDQAQLDLYDSNGRPLAAAVDAAAAGRRIGNFVDRSADGLPGVYYARVSGRGGDYFLIVTRDADFNAEPPAGFPPAAQTLGPKGAVQGYLNGIALTDAQQLLPDAGAAYDNFGATVSVSGDTAIVGAPYHDARGADSGSAYIFQRTADGWVQVAELLPDEIESGDGFGWSVSISGQTAVIGTGSARSAVGAYVFQETDSGWAQVAELSPAEGRPIGFGQSVSIDGTTVIVGALDDPQRGVSAGSAFVFQAAGGGWEEIAKLLPGDVHAGDRFGWSVAISDDLAIVGAGYAANPAGTKSGAAYVFRRSDASWTQVAKLRPRGRRRSLGRVRLFGFDQRPHGDRRRLAGR